MRCERCEAGLMVREALLLGGTEDSCINCGYIERSLSAADEAVLRAEQSLPRPGALRRRDPSVRGVRL